MHKSLFEMSLSKCRRSVSMLALSGCLAVGFLSAPAAAQVTAFKQALAEAASKDADLSEFYRSTGFTPIWTGLDEDDRSMRYVAEFPSHARVLEYNRQDIDDIIFDFTIRDENDIIQWEIFSGVRVDSLYPEHMGITMQSGDGLEPQG